MSIQIADYPVRLIATVYHVVTVDRLFPAGSLVVDPHDWWADYTQDCYRKGIPFGGAQFLNADHAAAQAHTETYLRQLHRAANCITDGEPIAVWPEGLPRALAHVPQPEFATR